MKHALKITSGSFTEWNGRSFRDTDGILHPAKIASLWTESERKAVGLYPIIEPTIPEGKVSTGSTLEYDPETDTVTRVHMLADKPGPSTDDVDMERDRRIEAGMVFNAVRYQTRAQDRENVAGASIMALAAITQGAQPGDLRWHGGDSDFVWIAEDNSLNPMDAQTFFAFGQAMAAHKSALIFAARALKDMDPIPADYADDKHWPQEN